MWPVLFLAFLENVLATLGCRTSLLSRELLDPALSVKGKFNF